MAQSQTAETNNVVSVSTLAVVFADTHNRFVLKAGPNNTEEALGRIYNVFVPRSYKDKNGETVDMIVNAKDYQRWLGTAWNGKRSKFDGKSESEKYALACDPANNGFQPAEMLIQSPVELALQNIIVNKNPTRVVGKTASQIVDFFAKNVAETLHDASKTERGREPLEKAIAELAAASVERSRKDGATKTKEEVASDELSIF